MWKAILDGHKVILTEDLHKWAEWFETNFKNRFVANDYLGDIRVSTIFMGIDHGFDDLPLWFETMIFGGPHNNYQERYQTWEQAEAGHAKALALAKE